MRYDPATYVRGPPQANTGSHGRQQPISTAPPAATDGAMSRQTAEIDDWEDEGGGTPNNAWESRAESVEDRE
jgi:hypothetical protein